MANVSEEHPIRFLGEKDIEVFNCSGGDVLAEIDYDEEVDLPIFGYARENGSYAVFLFPEGASRIRILSVKSENEGDMKHILDTVVSHFGVNKLNFFNVVNQGLLQRLTDVSTRTVQVGGEKVVVASCSWDPDRA